MNRFLLPILLAGSLTACGGDAPEKRDPVERNNGGTNNGASNNGGSNNGASNNGFNNGSSNNGVNNGASNNGASNNGSNNGVCDGCLADGVCEPGNTADACGGGGESCAVCVDGWVCSDGECFEPTTCGPDNCAGCCDMAGQCRTGSSDEVCGIGGASCEACNGSEFCSAGACTRPCAETCAGCCDGETCLAGTTDGACGMAGEACDSCGNDICDSGQCVAPDCATTCAGCCNGSTCLAGNTGSACGSTGDACMACAGGQTCNNGTCVTDPNSRWEMILVSGTVSANNPQNEPWDIIGSPDPVVEFNLYDAMNGVNYPGTSSVVQDDTTPTWNESIVTNVPARAFLNLTFDLYDSDFDLDDFVCGVDIDFTQDMATYNQWFGGGTLNIPCQHPDNASTFGSVNLRLQAVP